MPEKDISSIFTDNLKKLLTEHNMTYKELAEKLGVKSSSISMWMTGNSLPRMGLLDKLADLFNVSVESLITSKEERRESYYLNEDARDMAQFMFENPEYKVLFDASRKVKKEDIEFVKQMMNRLSSEPATYVNAAHADNYANAPGELKQQEEQIMDNKDF